MREWEVKDMKEKLQRRKAVRNTAKYLYGFKPNHEQDALIHDSGFKLLFYNGYKGTEILGVGGQKSHRIGCSFKKCPKKIAKDIEKRLLPDYKRDFINYRAEKAALEEKRAHHRQLMEALAHEALGEIKAHHGGHVKHNVYVRGANATITITENYREGYDAKISLDFGQALKLIKYLKNEGILVEEIEEEKPHYRRNKRRR